MKTLLEIVMHKNIICKDCISWIHFIYFTINMAKQSPLTELMKNA